MRAVLFFPGLRFAGDLRRLAAVFVFFAAIGCLSVFASPEAASNREITDLRRVT